jgi:DNA-binding CsgD family transcriptional regulator
MPTGFARYDEVVHRIYDAALRPQSWPDVVASIAHLLEASRAVLFTWAHSPAQGGFSFTHNIPEAAVALWAAKSMREDPLMAVALGKGLMFDNGVVIGAELVPTDVLVKTDFYRELWEPLAIGQVCCGTVFDGTDARKLPTALSLFRPLDDAAFARDDAEVLRRLAAHLSRAMGVMFHLRDSEWQVAANEAALDNLCSGVVLIDAEKKVRFANKQARRLLGQSRHMLVAPSNSALSQQLCLPHRLSPHERGFQQAVARALAPLAQDVAEHFSQALLLPSEDGKPGCVVHAVPLAPSNGFATAGATARAVVFLYDLQSAATVEPALLCKLFDMTPAEARAALQITQGGSVEEMAARTGVSLGTFKTQLRAAYTKSGTHRQADLLKLLLALASH